MDNKKRDTLEIDYVDSEGLSNTLEALADICLAKADHIRENWQDKGLAKMWDGIFRKINTLNATIKHDADYLQGKTF